MLKLEQKKTSARVSIFFSFRRHVIFEVIIDDCDSQKKFATVYSNSFSLERDSTLFRISNYVTILIEERKMCVSQRYNQAFIKIEIILDTTMLLIIKKSTHDNHSLHKDIIN